ncbi:MAG: RpiB/LacA/LacB family sugar-phosphate isomerase [Planctomycetia bacterium]
MCYDAATARNAREHNFANVLTLGGKLLKPAQAQEIVRTFLSTPHGEERHRKRVDKIRAIEQQHLRHRTTASAPKA